MNTHFDASSLPVGTQVFIPLNKLKKSPKNVRRVPHSEATLVSLRASIAAKGILQNLVVEPETDATGAPTGCYYVTIGEGRRLAQLRRVADKEIKKTEPMPCVINIQSDANEISLDENITREAMHPADQFEAFRTLAGDRGMGIEDIAARFGIAAHTVRQRLRLGAVSPRLMQAYRDGALSLEQLMAFAITDDHARQEAVYEELSSWERDAPHIRRKLTEAHVPASDRRAVFVGVEAYEEAGGHVIRDLFTEDRGGYFEDVVLLERLASERLGTLAADIQTREGWKWVQAVIDFPHAHGLRRTYPKVVEVSPEDKAAQVAVQEEYDQLIAECEDWDELPEGVSQRLADLEEEADRLNALGSAYDPEEVELSGVIVSLSHDGSVRVERGFQRAEDSVPDSNHSAPYAKKGVRDHGRLEVDHEHHGAGHADEDHEPERPLSDLLIRDLTTHRTLALRLALGDQPRWAYLALVHALAVRTFWHATDATCLEIRPTSTYLDSYADGLNDTPAAEALMARHTGWASTMPADPKALWPLLLTLEEDALAALLAHCVALTVNAVRQPHERRDGAHQFANAIADALGLDMSQHWKPTVTSYLGRVTKSHILDAVSDACGPDAAERITGLKKPAMAEMAEQLLAGTRWLPAILRTNPNSTSHEQSADAEVDGTA